MLDLNVTKCLMLGPEFQLKAGDVFMFLTHFVMLNTIPRTPVKRTHRIQIVLSSIIAWAGPYKICKNYLTTPSSHKGGFSLDRVRKWWVGGRGVKEWKNSEGMEEGCGWSEGSLLGSHMPQSLIQSLTRVSFLGHHVTYFSLVLDEHRADFWPETSHEVTYVNSHTKRCTIIIMHYRVLIALLHNQIYLLP